MSLATHARESEKTSLRNLRLTGVSRKRHQYDITKTYIRFITKIVSSLPSDLNDAGSRTFS